MRREGYVAGDDNDKSEKKRTCAKLRCFSVYRLLVEIISEGFGLFLITSEAVGIETCLPQCVSIRRSNVKCLCITWNIFSAACIIRARLTCIS